MVGCFENRKISHESPIKKLDGYFIEKYIYRYDSVGAVSGFWLNEKKLVSNSTSVLLTDHISDFYRVFQCDQFLKIEKYIRDKKSPNLSSISKGAEGYYFLDSIKRDLYFIANVSGNFFYVKEPFCSKDKDALINRKDKKACKYGKEVIKNYPFIIAVEYLSSDTVALKKVQEIIEIQNLKRVKIDTLFFPACF